MHQHQVLRTHFPKKMKTDTGFQWARPWRKHQYFRSHTCHPKELLLYLERRNLQQWFQSHPRHRRHRKIQCCQWKQLPLTWLLNCRPLTGSLAATSRIQNILSEHSSWIDSSQSISPPQLSMALFPLMFDTHPFSLEMLISQTKAPLWTAQYPPSRHLRENSTRYFLQIHTRSLPATWCISSIQARMTER